MFPWLVIDWPLTGTCLIRQRSSTGPWWLVMCRSWTIRSKWTNLLYDQRVTSPLSERFVHCHAVPSLATCQQLHELSQQQDRKQKWFVHDSLSCCVRFQVPVFFVMWQPDRSGCVWWAASTTAHSRFVHIRIVTDHSYSFVTWKLWLSLLRAVEWTERWPRKWMMSDI